MKTSAPSWISYCPSSNSGRNRFLGGFVSKKPAFMLAFLCWLTSSLKIQALEQTMSSVIKLRKTYSKLQGEKYHENHTACCSYACFRLLLRGNPERAFAMLERTGKGCPIFINCQTCGA